ncbi:MAG TPA: hypothetical protein VD815_07040 [Candidatus Saccharimonadales bacterium]|nr:hypothetical protein [Candidatus Saccharimonadales bacterium]
MELKGIVSPVSLTTVPVTDSSYGIAHDYFKRKIGSVKSIEISFISTANEYISDSLNMWPKS